MSKRKRYSPEYKHELVELVRLNCNLPVAEIDEAGQRIVGAVTQDQLHLPSSKSSLCP